MPKSRSQDLDARIEGYEATLHGSRKSSMDDSEDSPSKKMKHEVLNITSSTLNENVTLNSEDFMNTSIDTNISINSEDYENYILGNDFKPSDKCRDLELSRISLDDGLISDATEAPQLEDEQQTEPSASVDDILAKYSHLQSLGSPASVETSASDSLLGSVLKENSLPQKQKESSLKSVSRQVTSQKIPNATTKATPKTTKPRSKMIRSPRAAQDFEKSPLKAQKPSTERKIISLKNPPNVNTAEESKSIALTPNGQKQRLKGGKTSNQGMIKSLNDTDRIQSSTSTPNKIISSQSVTTLTENTPSKTFQCDECLKMLSSKYNLKKHKENVHDKRRTPVAT